MSTTSVSMVVTVMACMCNYNCLVRSLSVAVLETMTNEFSNNLIRDMCPLSVSEGGRGTV